MQRFKQNKLLVCVILFVLTYGVLYGLLCYSCLRFDYVLSTELLIGIPGTGALLMLAFSNLSKKREFQGIEQGSSRWATGKEIAKLADRKGKNNILISQNAKLSMNPRRTGLNQHVLIFGGSGSGKSRYYIKPNVMQMNASYLIVDPKGEHLADEGTMLQESGYKIKVFDIKNIGRGMTFNPLKYFRNTKDIFVFVNMLIENTAGAEPEDHQKEDFWVKAERLWLMSHLSYVMEECLPEEQNINSVITLLDYSDVKEDDEDYKSAIDILFDELERKNPKSFAAKLYKKYKLAAGKTAKSVLVSVGVRLAIFDIPEISDMFSDDELELERIGQEKTALFVIMDDSDTTYNHLAALMINTLFQINIHYAGRLRGKRLPIPVRCLLDEIANIGKFPNLHRYTAVIRSYGMSLEMAWQNIDQGKAIYGKNWPTIESNCDTVLFLGGKGENTTKYVSNVMVGKTTIDTVSYGGSGSAGSLGVTGYNSTQQKSGRKLIDENEVSKLPIDQCIVSFRGHEPFLDNKVQTEKHKNYPLLADDKPAREFIFNKAPSGIDLNNYRGFTEINLTEVI